MMLLLGEMRVHQLWLDVVEVVHLFAFVVFEKTLVGAQLFLVVRVEAVCNAVECLGFNLMQHILTVSLSERVSVVITTLSHRQESK